MEKIKKSHLILIAVVVLLTIYNILPTIIYYSKPLSKPINYKQAQKIAFQSLERIEKMQQGSVKWLKAYTKHLGLNPKSIEIQSDNPQLIEVSFFKPEHAKKFKAFLPRAGSMIGFAPAQLSLASENEHNPTRIFVEQKVGLQADPKQIDQLFQYIPKKEGEKLSSTYQNLIKERLSQMALILAGQSANAQLAMLPHALIEAATEINSVAKTFGENSPFTRRYFMSFTQAHNEKAKSIQPLIDQLEKLEKELSKKAGGIQNKDEEKSKLLSDQKQVTQAIKTIKRNQKAFESGEAPLTAKVVQDTINLENNVLKLGNKNPFIHSLEVDWARDEVKFRMHPDIENLLTALVNSQDIRLKKDKLNQLIINEVARVSQRTNEVINPAEEGYIATLNQLDNVQSYLLMDLGYIAQMEVAKLIQKINAWSPESPEFANNAFPIWDYQTYLQLPDKDKQFGMIVYAPVIDSDEPLSGFQNGSIYVIAKGLNPILQKYQQFANLQQAENFKEEFIQLQNILKQMGFQFSYLAAEGGFSSEFHQDFIFENPSYYSNILAASRENFSVYGNKKYALLELTNLEQRILASNKIESQMHEELLKWNDDYQASLVDIHDAYSRFLIPPPTQNIFLNNFLLNLKEYFRGDNRKVLKWGLDLMGGKSILIGLKDHNNKPIHDKESLIEGANELTQRVNKMGLSEVDIRVQNNYIALDFPSSKGLSANELIKGSSMSFHIINEKFSSKNSPYYNAMQKFLQDVWNEAVITNRKDMESINLIAFKHLGGTEESLEFHPRSEHAKELYEHGLKLANPHNNSSQSDLDMTLSLIGMYRGEDYSHWRGQGHPLIVMFNNYALEGADIENVRTNYDPSHGNTLTFNIKGTAKTPEKKSPRDVLNRWTTEFAKDKIVGSPYEKYTLTRGWRMAIVLNGQVINDPQLNQALHDNVQVSGGFTQHEASRLAADLKAGSLSFTPQILSVENVSADLGQAERIQGITATVIALVLVIVLMIGYYRFSGIIASIAVLFNLLIMWAVLQNLQATLTLSGIAGIILTVGMAVDANVLVFERIREELKQRKSLAIAISTGYKKAFSAILDSNLTTIIAAVILLNFDAGPIKGLAITLTIGIASSMFTALFMTRTFFAHWLTSTKARTLKMANWFRVKTTFDFLKKGRLVALISIFTIVVGGTLLFQQNKSIFGMDFTGGYSLNMQIDPTTAIDYRKEVAAALLSAGAKSTDFQIRELGQPHSLRVQFSSALDEKGRPFFGLPIEHKSNVKATWQNNPRLNWIVEALAAKQIKLTSQSLANLEKNWSEMSGQLSKSTRNNALIGLSLALVSILIYISFRYEIKYAISAILCIVHDVLISIALIAILHFMGVTIQINMQVIAALMTIIGYSLNDTIIVFDRIREDKKIFKAMAFDDVINQSIAVTLNRTIMTSLTTFVVLLALVLLGGAKIFDFSLLMSLGIILGTLSSLFIAPLILQLMNQKEQRAQNLPTAIKTNTAI